MSQTKQRSGEAINIDTSFGEPLAKRPHPVVLAFAQAVKSVADRVPNDTRFGQIVVGSLLTAGSGLGAAAFFGFQALTAPRPPADNPTAAPIVMTNAAFQKKLDDSLTKITQYQDTGKIRTACVLGKVFIESARDLATNPQQAQLAIATERNLQDATNAKYPNAQGFSNPCPVPSSVPK